MNCRTMLCILCLGIALTANIGNCGEPVRKMTSSPSFSTNSSTAKKLKTWNEYKHTSKASTIKCKRKAKMDLNKYGDISIIAATLVQECGGESYAGNAIEK